MLPELRYPLAPYLGRWAQGVREDNTFLEDSRFSFHFFFFLIYLCIFGCVGSSPLCEDPRQLRRAGATPHRGARASHYRGLSCCGAPAPDAQAQ